MTNIAPEDIPKVMPPIAKKPTKNKTLSKGNETPYSLEIPAKTPPNCFLLVSLTI